MKPFFRRQDAAYLIAGPLDLAKHHNAVQARIAHRQLADRPDAVAAALEKTLPGWRRPTRFWDNREARELGRVLDGWLHPAVRELLRKDPPTTLSRFESFIAPNVAWFDRADDSDDVIGGAACAGCRHWLHAAARCETPSVEVFRISAALPLLAEALRDADITVHASLRYSPNPNPVQRPAFAQGELEPTNRPTRWPARTAPVDTSTTLVTSDP